MPCLYVCIHMMAMFLAFSGTALTEILLHLFYIKCKTKNMSIYSMTLIYNL